MCKQINEQKGGCVWEWLGKRERHTNVMDTSAIQTVLGIPVCLCVQILGSVLNMEFVVFLEPTYDPYGLIFFPLSLNRL